MLAWLSERAGRGSSGGVNRQGRRALTRLARLPRGTTDRIVWQLRQLRPADREKVLARLPLWQQEQLRSLLGQHLP